MTLLFLVFKVVFLNVTHIFLYARFALCRTSKADFIKNIRGSSFSPVLRSSVLQRAVLLFDGRFFFSRRLHAQQPTGSSLHCRLHLPYELTCIFHAWFLRPPFFRRSSPSFFTAMVRAMGCIARTIAEPVHHQLQLVACSWRLISPPSMRPILNFIPSCTVVVVFSCLQAIVRWMQAGEFKNHRIRGVSAFVQSDHRLTVIFLPLLRVSSFRLVDLMFCFNFLRTVPFKFLYIM